MFHWNSLSFNFPFLDNPLSYHCRWLPINHKACLIRNLASALLLWCQLRSFDPREYCFLFISSLGSYDHEGPTTKKKKIQRKEKRIQNITTTEFLKVQSVSSSFSRLRSLLYISISCVSYCLSFLTIELAVWFTV